MISAQQVQLIQAAHAGGLLDRQIAEAAGVSVATVKRVRVRLGLMTNCVTAQRGREGEEFVAALAAARGLDVVWRQENGEGHDLVIAGRRVDVKTAMQMQDGSWRFRLGSIRQSYFNTHQYEKDYAKDCDVLVVVCQEKDGRHTHVFFLESACAVASVRLRPGHVPAGVHDDWVWAFTGSRQVAA